MSSLARGGSGIVLLYHRIANAPRDPFGLCVAPEMFNQQMRYLRHTCAPLSLAEFAAALSTQSLPQRAVAITFDDGYVDNLTTAAPLLASYDLSATFFVTTGDLEKPHEFWWDALTDNAEYEEESIRQVHGRALLAPLDERNELLEPWLQLRPAVTAHCRHRPLLGAELGRLAETAGQEIGAHTVNHLFLPAQAEAVCRTEFRDCRRILQERLGRHVGSVAYPFGGVTPAISQLAAEAGYEIGVTVNPRAVRLEDDLLALPRVPINADLTDFPAYIDHLFIGGAAAA